MDTPVDFLNWLHHDISVKILTCLDDPSDLVRVSSVSRSWRRFVVANGLFKQLCLRLFPSLQRVDCINESSCGMQKMLEVGCSKFVEREILEKEHRAYAFLARGCASFPLRDCILDAISASSTDNYPLESVRNTLDPLDRVGRAYSYWSSEGQSSPEVPEMLTYKLVADVCLVTEIKVKPFQAVFQSGLPLYSAKFVRFRLGHPKAPMDDPMDEPYDDSSDDRFVWTYVSPIFPMLQENHMQSFVLPEPVLCIGGILQVELLGRVQRQEIDGLFYICVSHVQVVGRPLSPPFGAKIIEPSGKFVLEVQSYNQPSLLECEHSPFTRASLHLEQIVNILRGHAGAFEEYGWNEEHDESDEEFAIGFTD